METRIISVINRKGGTGKTTTTINLGSCLAELGKKVLLIDVDPQSNTTIGLGMPKKLAPSISECLLNEDDEPSIDGYIYETGYDNLFIIPANNGLSVTESEIKNINLRRELLLKDRIDNSKLEFDFILIDCPPSLDQSMLPVNAMMASNELLIPLNCGFFSMDGVAELYQLYTKVAKVNKDLKICGVLLTMVDDRTNAAKKYKEELSKLFEDKFFNTYIKRNVTISDAQESQKPINHFDKNSIGYDAYMNLAKEVLNNG